MIDTDTEGNIVTPFQEDDCDHESGNDVDLYADVAGSDSDDLLFDAVLSIILPETLPIL